MRTDVVVVVKPMLQVAENVGSGPEVIDVDVVAFEAFDDGIGHEYDGVVYMAKPIAAPKKRVSSDV